MTSGKRDDWHRNRAAVRALGGPAAQTLEAIESAVFHVCLSEHAPDTPVETMNALCYGGCAGKRSLDGQEFFHGRVRERQGRVQYEHSHADAPMHSRMVEMMKHIVHTEGRKELAEFFAQPEHVPVGGGGGGGLASTVRRLSWCHDNALAENRGLLPAHETATEFARQHIAGHRLSLMDFRDFGKNTLKQFRVSPDSFVQCALQLAFWRDQGGRVTSTYETGTTRGVHHGRTECIRPLTSASREMVDCWIGLARDAARASRCSDG